MRPIPKQQGDEDGFCGLYAILNAIDYLYPDLTETQNAGIFKACARAIGPWPDVVWSGTSTNDVSKMLAAVRYPRLTLSVPFIGSHHIAFKLFFKELHEMVAPDHQVAIIGLEAPYEHWTVAREVTGDNIILQDSCQIHEIHLEDAGAPRSKAKWRIDPKCTFLIARPTP